MRSCDSRSGLEHESPKAAQRRARPSSCASLAAACSALLAVACASVEPQGIPPPPFPPPYSPQGPQLPPYFLHYGYDRTNALIAQGWFGLSELQSDNFESGADLPVIGGTFQQALGGTQQAVIGFEGGLSFDFNSDVVSVSSGGGGLVIRTENDMLLTELFGGPYVDLLLAQRWRLYGGAGPLLQFAHVDADVDDPSSGIDHVASDGFGGGWYARTGLEYVVPSGFSFGFGVRYVDSDVDFGGILADYDLERVQWLFTLTRFF